jgi:hypothetical protein
MSKSKNKQKLLEDKIVNLIRKKDVIEISVVHKHHGYIRTRVLTKAGSCKYREYVSYHRSCFTYKSDLLEANLYKITNKVRRTVKAMLKYDKCCWDNNITYFLISDGAHDIKIN